MRRPRIRTASVIVAATSLCLTGVLAGCGSSTPTAGPSGSPSASGSGTTAEGAQEELGKPATVDWSPKAGVNGQLSIAVDNIETTSFKQAFTGWKLDKDLLTRAPYFVRATIRNAGKTDLGGYSAPLWGLDGDNNLIQPAEFTEAFKPCAPKTLPTPFPPGASANVCLVMLVPDQGRLVGVSFRPDESFQPITWKGDLTTYTPPKSPAASPSAKPSSSPS